MQAASHRPLIEGAAMILLDTNVVSELMRTSPDPAVEAWIADHPVEDLFFSAVGEAELRYGAAIMPTGRRRETLVLDIETMLHAAFENRILPSTVGRHAPMRSSPPSADSRGVPSHPRSARSRRLLGRAAWRWRRETFGISRRWGSMYSTHGTPMSRTTQAFARVKIDALQRLAGWELTDDERHHRKTQGNAGESSPDIGPHLEPSLVGQPNPDVLPPWPRSPGPLQTQLP